MSDPTTAVVADGDEEGRTRDTYTDWMRRALRTVTDLAGEADGTGWPDADPPAELPRTTWTAEPHDGAACVAAALANGWLVAPGPASDVDPAPGPLSGLTVGVKDIIDVAGTPTRRGTPGAGWADPAGSAAAWSLLAAAGGRCVGKTATHEMAWGVTTPQIANPHAADRIAGGSSGGSAACVASGAARGALGTDTGGSIRIPAALCGVVGFRPTTGRVPSAGVMPLARAQDAVGPLAADLDTCTAMLEVLLGRGLGTGRPDSGLAGLRIGVLADPGRLDAGVRGAYERTLGVARDTGATLVPLDTRVHRDAAAVSLVTMLMESAGLHAAAVRAAPASFGGEARALLTVGEVLGPEEPLVRSARTTLRTRTARLLADERLDAALTPTVPCVAPLRGADVVRIDDRDEPVAAALVRFTAWASVTAMPALSLPVRAPGLPVAVQVMARPDHEHVCARVARALHAAESAGS